jgi:4-diphosphocytidyl-2-C-methyl-D-erythritol kinase
MRIDAPAKLNLCLFLGPRREDGLHELCSLFEPLALADSLTISEIGSVSAGEVASQGNAKTGDEVVCPDVEGENLAARALSALRARGWGGPSLRVEVEKRIPVAAGLGGGSADAAAILRLARDWCSKGAAADPNATSGSGEIPDEETRAGGGGPSPAVGAAGRVSELDGIAAALGADVPSQLVPALSLVRGAGERVERLPQPAPHAAVLLPGGGGLGTAEVFAEADRLGLGREADELEELAARLRRAAGAGASPFDYAELLVNDLEPAARSLRPQIGEALDALRGAPLVFMTGSGPTAVGLFPDLAAAEQAAARLGRDDAIVCEAGRAP